MVEPLWIALGIMVVGLIGCIIPVLPGPPLVWLGALYYGWQTNFTVVGWPLLVFLLVLAVAGGTADFWLSMLGARKGGASPWAQVAALAGGIIGLIAFSLPGMLIGAVGAIAALEYYRLRDWNHVIRAGGGYLAGYLISVVVEIFTAVIMIGIFLAWVVLLPMWSQSGG